MGLALADAGSKLAIGTTIQVWEFRDVPDVARRLEPSGTHDACYLPRSSLRRPFLRLSWRWAQLARQPLRIDDR